jgi:transposase InsO family protein
MLADAFRGGIPRHAAADDQVAPRRHQITPSVWPRPLSASAQPQNGGRRRQAEKRGVGEQIDCFFVGRLAGTKGAVWQLTAIDVASSYAWAELVRCPQGNPTGAQTSKLARRVCAELAEAGWRLERVLSDNGGEFRSRDFRQALAELGVRHTLIRAGRPQTNGAVEALHRLILEECWRPAFARYLHVRFTGLKRDLARYLDDYNYRRVHNGRLTRGRIPADIVYGAAKVKTR